MLKARVDYPSRAEERMIMERMTGATLPMVTPVVTPSDILRAREAVKQVYVDEKIKDYVLDLVIRTRQPGNNGLADLNSLIQFGASPRASINLILAARAHAFLQGRGFVTPEDIKALAPDILRHRIITTYEAEAENITSDHIVRRILDYTPVP
jgi:MoxR-like ATPase